MKRYLPKISSLFLIAIVAGLSACSSGVKLDDETVQRRIDFINSA